MESTVSDRLPFEMWLVFAAAGGGWIYYRQKGAIGSVERCRDPLMFAAFIRILRVLTIGIGTIALGVSLPEAEATAAVGGLLAYGGVVTMMLFLGGSVGWYCLLAYRLGHIYHRSSRMQRETEPFFYWLTLGWFALMALVLMVGAAYFAWIFALSP